MKTYRKSVTAKMHLKLVAIASVLALNPAMGEIALDFVYDTSNNRTTVSWSGTWDVSATGTFGGILFSTSSNGFEAFNGLTGIASGTGIGGARPWSTSQTDWVFIDGSSHFGFNFVNVAGPTGFTDTTDIVGSMWRSGSLTDLGFGSNSPIAGQLTGPGGTVNWSTAVIPEPSTYALLLGLCCTSYIMIRRLRK